ncbi:hypothetical protein AAV94_11005 [Lampropedia cohaerens]|uniref:Thioredoxin domain-containing protein n=1 Tax=Lampropedia cohaerens TaxID=1610491 RepID=A0A0U1PXW8_9BURK|nr:thioredoxin family protein [Lampropedia cohaerens]KKW67364.1 hypothetical protein AAV94_11005 [Lampropedia cohaerens]
MASDTAAATDGKSVAPLRVVGLCAAWCGVCREYAPLFAQFAAQAPDVTTVWLDVEEPAISAALDDVDVETFPTIAIGRGDTLLFWGDVLPHLRVLERLVADLRDPLASAPATPAAYQRAWRALQPLLRD